mgnify:CR=1
MVELIAWLVTGFVGSMLTLYAEWKDGIFQVTTFQGTLRKATSTIFTHTLLGPISLLKGFVLIIFLDFY